MGHTVTPSVVSSPTRAPRRGIRLKDQPPERSPSEPDGLQGEPKITLKNAQTHIRPGALAFTQITATKPRELTKRFVWTGDTLNKISVAELVDGSARQIEIPSLEAFGRYLDTLPSNMAVVYGVADGHPEARVVSQAREAATPGAITRTRRYFGFRRAPGIWMLDHDPDSEHPALAPRDLVAALRALAPCLAEAQLLWRPSVSSGVITPDGQNAGLRGQRLYIPVADAALIPEAGKALVDLLWASGYGWIKIGKAGQALERTLFDATVWQPERLDFAAPPLLGEGLRREAPPSFIDGSAPAWFDLRALIAFADGAIRSRAAHTRKAARDAAKPELLEAQAEWIETEAPRLAERAKIELDTARATLKRAAVKRELVGSFVLHGADGATPTVGELLDNPAKWHGKRFGDPLEPDYGQDKRIAWANLRSGGRPYLFSHAHGGRRFYLVRPSARIQLKVGERARVVDNLLDLLRARGDLFDYGEGAALARITEDARALPVTADWLADHLDRTTEFFTIKVYEDGSTEEVSQDAPQWSAKRLMAKDGERGLSRLDAVITAPTLRRDGSILTEPGYDPASRLLLLADAPDLPAVPLAPTTHDARAALETLWHPFRLFPLVDAVDRGVVLQALLTACVRASLPTAPGVALDAPAAGTGKTLLAQAIGALSVGYVVPALPPASNQDEECRKRLFAALRDGHRVLLWDNVREPLGNGALDAFMTASTFADRILGKSETANLPNRALFLTTGNNLRLVGDTCRRIFPARLDARQERPYAREFDFCPLEYVLSRRLSLVTSALVLMRAWIAAGRPRHGKGRTASFEHWDDLVRQAVCWITTWDERFRDPLEAVERAFAHDPETNKLAAVLDAVRELYAHDARHKHTVGQLVAWANEETPYDADPKRAARSALKEALIEIAGERNGSINPRILGRWIERNAERRCNGLRFVQAGTLHRALCWTVAADERPVSTEAPNMAEAVYV